MKKHTENEYMWHVNVHLIFGDTHIHKMLSHEYNEIPTFGEILQWCKDAGYERGTILMVAESWTSGAVYRYGNYNDGFWYECGSTEGFA